MKPLVAWLLCGTLTLQLYALSLPEFLRSALHEVSLESEWTNPLWVLTETLSGLRIGFSGTAVVICGTLLVGVGWMSIVRESWRAGVALVLPALLGGSMLLALGHNLWPRFFFFSMGFALLIVVRGAMTLPRLLLAPTAWRADAQTQRRLGVALACLMIVASGTTVPRCYAFPKQDFSGARDFVERQRAADDGMVAVGLAGVAYQRYYAPHWAVAQTWAELEALQHAHANLWLVYTLPIQVKTYRPEIWLAIKSEFEVVKVFPGTLGGGEVYVCRLRPADRSADTSHTATTQAAAAGAVW